MGRKGKAVTYSQIKKIYALAKEYGMDNDLLHEHMGMLTGKASMKELSMKEAAALIDSLEGKNAGRSAKDRATSRQMHYIYGLMKEIGWADEDGRPDMKRLNRFLGSPDAGFRVSDYRLLNIGMASNLIEALKAMASRGQGKKVAE